jgi:polar amino acid transport system substrate-binding protein
MKMLKEYDCFMKKLASILLVVIIVLAVALTFVGCKDKDSEYNLVKKGTLTVSTNAAFAPFEYTLEDGTPTGIDMDIAKIIADELGLALKIDDMEFDSVITAVTSKTADIAMAGLTVTEERKKAVLFTDTYYNSEQVVIAKTGDDILTKTTAEDVRELLKNQKVGAQNGTTGYFYITGDDDFGYDDIDGLVASGYTNGTAAVMALKNDQIKYVVIDRLPAEALVANNTGIAVCDVALTAEEYAFAVQLGNTALADKVNKIVADLVSSGKFNEIFKRHTIGE